MTIAKLDGVYLYVEDLDRAISFYESFLGMKVKIRYFYFSRQTQDKKTELIN